MQNACVHIYYGDGKGKTTAALGLCMRCSGRGGKVLFTSFLKNFNSGEFLHNLPFEVVKEIRIDGFWCDFSEEKREEVKRQSQKLLIELFERAKSEEVDLLVLDEVLNGVKTGCIDEDLLLELIQNRPCNTEIVMTGYTATDRIIEAADYATNIKCIKHPYAKGINARKGIEF